MADRKVAILVIAIVLVAGAFYLGIQNQVSSDNSQNSTGPVLSLSTTVITTTSDICGGSEVTEPNMSAPAVSPGVYPGITLCLTTSTTVAYTTTEAGSFPIPMMSIYDNYSSNQALANSAYQEKRVYVSISVGDATKDSQGRYVSLAGPSEFEWFALVFWQSQDAAASVPTGENISAQCTVTGFQSPDSSDEVDGFVSDVGPVLVLSNCVVIPVLNLSTNDITISSCVQESLTTTIGTNSSIVWTNELPYALTLTIGPPGPDGGSQLEGQLAAGTTHILSIPFPVTGTYAFDVQGHGCDVFGSIIVTGNQQP